MFKKCMLVLAFATGSFIEAESDTNHTLAIIAATTVCAGTGVYLAMRESNAVKIERAERWLQYYAANLHYELAEIVTLQDMQKFAGKSTRFKKEMLVICEEIEQSYREIDARYGSWIKPWNWNAQMKRAHAKIKELHQTMALVKMMFKYQPLMANWSYVCDEVVLVKSVQAICQGCSSYPLSFCAEMMQSDLKFLHKTHFKISCDVALIDMLEKLLQCILSTTTYVEEKRIQEEITIKERQAKAQETQAAAQLAQAQAQMKQAQAQKERNEIERKKLDRR